MVDFSRQQLSNQVVSDSARSTCWEMARWMAVGALFVGLILAYSKNHMVLLDIRYQMENLERKNARLRENQVALRAEYNSLINPEKIARQAQAMGLISSNQTGVRIIEGSDFPAPEENLVAETRRRGRLENATTE
ncbi:MAG: septum formation initiator family protein [Acidobacteriota bacterium]